MDKVSFLVDPQSRPSKVHVLMDNTSGGLQVGATGSLELVRVRSTGEQLVSKLFKTINYYRDRCVCFR